VDRFYQAAFAHREEDAKRLTREALSLLKARQVRYFQQNKAILRQLDPIFLSMEGLGQFVAVAWLMHPEGGKVPFAVAVEGFRRNRKWWSQEEGLAMFLVLDRLTNPDWATDVFGEKPKYITDLLEQASGEAVKK
jgi:hypothetical protein